MSTAFLIFILLFSLNFFILFCMIYRILNNNILIYWNNFLYLKSFYLTSTCDVFYKLLTSIEKQGLALTKKNQLTIQVMLVLNNYFFYTHQMLFLIFDNHNDTFNSKKRNWSFLWPPRNNFIISFYTLNWNACSQISPFYHFH